LITRNSYSSARETGDSIYLDGNSLTGEVGLTPDADRYHRTGTRWDLSQVGNSRLYIVTCLAAEGERRTLLLAPPSGVALEETMYTPPSMGWRIVLA
jgi:hypothetical protein